MYIDKKNKIRNNKIKTEKRVGILLNPEIFMQIAYGAKSFYIRDFFPYLDGKKIFLGSKVGHAGDGCIPGHAAMSAVVDKIQEIKPGLYRYKLKSINVFEPVKIDEADKSFFWIDEGKKLNYLDHPDNSEWVESYFYPYVNGAYKNYEGTWVVPDPEYV